MKYLYLALFFFSGVLLNAQDTAIRRASLSTSVAGAHSIQKGNYKVQQSVGHSGIASIAKHAEHTASRGFLLPQLGVSTSETIPDFDWTVYPNPFNGFINIDFDVPVSGPMVVRLHDVAGQLIMVDEVKAKQQQRILLDHLAQAEYLLSVEIMGKTFSQILLKYKKPNEE